MGILPIYMDQREPLDSLFFFIWRMNCVFSFYISISLMCLWLRWFVVLFWPILCSVSKKVFRKLMKRFYWGLLRNWLCLKLHSLSPIKNIVYTIFSSFMWRANIDSGYHTKILLFLLHFLRKKYQISFSRIYGEHVGVLACLGFKM